MPTILQLDFVDSEDSTGQVIPGDCRSVVNDYKCLHNLFRLNGNRYRFEADQVKESFKEFVIGRDSEVNWQYKLVRCCATVHDQEKIQNTTSKASYRNTEYQSKASLYCLLYVYYPYELRKASVLT